jgi:hypothetical protein
LPSVATIETKSLVAWRARRSEFPLADVLQSCPRLARACSEDDLERSPAALLGNRS